MQRVFNVLVPPKFGFDVYVTEQARFRVELLAVNAQEAAVEGNGREEGERRRVGARFEGDGRWGGRGEEAEGGAHRFGSRETRYANGGSAW